MKNIDIFSCMPIYSNDSAHSSLNNDKKIQVSCVLTTKYILSILFLKFVQLGKYFKFAFFGTFYMLSL